MFNLKKYFTQKELIFLFSIILLGLGLRLFNLDLRPFHHDESLNAIYGKYFYENPQTGFYKYNPLVHGPLLYNLQPFIYEIFGTSIWSARIPMVFFSFLMMISPLFFRKYFSPATLLYLISFLSISPSLIYWSRFVREDALVFFALLVMALGCWRFRPKLGIYLILTGLALHYTAKENIFVFLALISGYLVFEFFFLKILRYEYRPTIQNAIDFVKSNKLHFLAATALSIFIFCYFYSAGFRYGEGILDGLYRKSLLYWLDQHNIERIKGPLSFQFLFLSWYELPFLLFFITHLIHFYFFQNKFNFIFFVSLFVACISTFSYFQFHNVEGSYLGQMLKMKIPIDAPIAILLIAHAIFLTCWHLLRNERGLAFWGYFFMSSFFTYSYLGEKVPWLSQYIYYPALIYFALYFDSSSLFHKNYIRKIRLDIIFLVLAFLGFIFAGIFYLQPPHYKTFPLLISSAIFLLCYLVLKNFPSNNYLPLGKFFILFALIFNLRSTIQTNFTFAGDAQEFIGQVHTTKEIHGIALKLFDEVTYPTSGIRPKILVTGDAIWPLNWYFHGLPDYKFFSEDHELVNYDYVFDSKLDRLLKHLSNSHKIITIKLRGWWVPNYDELTLVNYLNYLIWHIPWNDPGYLDIYLASKK